MALMPVHRDDTTAAFFDGTARGEFLLLHDAVSGDILDPRTDTSFNRSRFTHVPASGRGVVVSWAVNHTRSPGGEVRSVIGIVELEEGPWWWSELRGFDPDVDLAGAAVVVGFERSGEADNDESIPYFTRAANGAAPREDNDV